MAQQEKDEVCNEDESDLSFEEALSRLEEIIYRMESGESPLESLVENYQSGVQLLKLCRSRIESAEMKIKEVTEKDGDLMSQDLPKPKQ